MPEPPPRPTRARVPSPGDAPAAREGRGAGQAHGRVAPRRAETTHGGCAARQPVRRRRIARELVRMSDRRGRTRRSDRRGRTRRAAAWALGALLALAGAARAQVQTPDQRACTSAMHGALAAVASAAARGVDACVRAASRAALPAGTDVEACAAADAKLAKAAARAGGVFDAKCAGDGKRPPGSPKRPAY